MTGLKSFLTARYGYVLAMVVTIFIGIVGLVKAFEFPHGDDGPYLIAAAIAFGAATLASRGR